ncbi:hypothetical protein ACPOL_3488 [Acidisarcina polymorpha]|uniref:Uncharacterized protein n=1 Tax=Acidisarcina polymorpha TaxID=2211140 RepID=A0A2Z5G0T4_9BACT|nr:hypothetical protein ACPOL_3488 [Acidisarcina polymorpha]
MLTQHNDISRSGQNLNETILTPNNVNATLFGKLFSQPVNGQVRAQPLFVSRLAIPNKGTHNVVYVATANDYVYAFDADNNGGGNARPLWSVSLLTNTTPAGTYTSEFGVIGTPSINLTTKTIYLVSSEARGSTFLFRLHALDLSTGAEKFGGPVPIEGTIEGTGNGSTGGKLTFDPGSQYQRAGLLLLNGVVYISFCSQNDAGTWHGWIFSYNEQDLNQINIFSTTRNGTGGGIWMSGAGLAAEVNAPDKPFGRMFLATGNGSFTATKPYSNSMGYSMSVLNLDLSNGVMTVKDEFTPHDWSVREAQDGDVGSGAPILLPNQTTASGKTFSPLVQMGKSGTMYLLDRNQLGGFDANSDQIVQEIQTPEFGPNKWGTGIWGAPAYWNGNLYFGGAQYDPVGSRVGASLAAYSIVKGRISTAATSQSAELFSFPGPTPSVSANGKNDGIVWVLKTDTYTTGGNEVLFAYNANDLADLLYSSNTHASRDNAGPAEKFVVPTVANGKVFVGASDQVSVYGLLNDTPTAPPPIFVPDSKTFHGSLSVAIEDSIANSTIFYTTDGTTPTTSSTVYRGAFTINSNETITAIASAADYLQSAPSSATYTDSADTANPVFSLSSGAYTGTQSLKITDSTKGARIYYTIDGSTPTTSSNLYSQPLSVSVSASVRAFAVAPGLNASPVVLATYTIEPPYTFNYNQGFSGSQSTIQYNGTAGLDDFRLQLTDGGQNEAGSVFYKKKVNIQSFTTAFTFQLSNPLGDGFTFSIQNESATARGSDGGGLGYQGMGKSLAIKFDLFSNAGEGPDSTGLYLNGATPTLPAINLSGTGINLHSGDYIDAYITYDGTDLTMTLTDQVTLASWSHAFAVNIPSVVGGDTAYVGFTGGTGGSSSSQKLTAWTYLTGPLTLPNYAAGFDPANLTLNRAKLSGAALELTNGYPNETASAYFSKPVNITAFTVDFEFEVSKGSVPPFGDGATFVIQNSELVARGGTGGGLGYSGIPKSLAIKLDLYSNAGEGSDSTGLYTGGATPTVPTVNLTPSRVVLSSGHPIHAHITYNGTTLTWTLRDMTSGAKFTSSPQKINIPETVDGNTAYVGFTAASGGATAVQKILNWTVTNP